MGWKAAGIVGVGLVIGAGVLFSVLVASPGGSDPNSLSFVEQRQIKKVVEGYARDPDSLQFRNLRRGKNGAACGEMNAKNGFGGYMGFTPFVVESSGKLYTEAIEDKSPDTITSLYINCGYRARDSLQG